MLLYPSKISLKRIGMTIQLVQDWEAFHKELSGILAQHQRTS